MKLYRVHLVDLRGHGWIERIEAMREIEVKDIVYARYGLVAAVIAVTH